ncbi:hypothetical protein DVH24_008856 [Malus domestica]|uniref:Glutathione S-transferase n=1 Tax=Malus domestica TaxID=3750 RepID=A0A498JS06_MALDO|nr:hypothetical protein DVH24_008856 [Malus domestica]
MAEENKVTLYGMWASPFVKRVVFALILKGIPYEYVEEDLRNKSSLLLKLNAESLVILEYIDEIWKTGPQLLSQDPYKRSQARFWAGFMQHILESLAIVLETSGEAQEKAIKEVSERVRLLEERLKGYYPDGFPRSFDLKDVGLLEVVIFSHFGCI